MRTGKFVFARRRRRGRVVVATLVLVAGMAYGAQALLTPPGGGLHDQAGAAPTDAAATGAPERVLPSAAPTSPVPSPRAPASPTPTAESLPPDLAALSGHLDGLLGGMAESLAGTDLAIAVVDQDGRLVFDHHADARLLPASTMKTVTAAAALEVLGADHRFETVVGTTGTVEGGVVAGDLVLVGGGDPALVSDDYHRWVYPARPWTSLTALADAVVEAGVTHVTGGVVADATAWGPHTLAAGWPDHYLSDQDARHISALTVDAGLRVQVTTPPEGEPEVELTTVDDPGRRAAARLAALLAERGVVISRGVSSSVVPVSLDQRLAAVASPPVAELLTFTMQRSDNHLADSLLRATAHAHTGRGTWSSADRTATDVLERLGIDPTGLRVADGSGLSRLDRVTAAQLVAIDRVMTSGSHADTWVDSLAVTGETGTLRQRLVGTPGQGRFRGKTGTLDDVKAVVGHVTGSDGRRLHLAVVSNGVPAGGQWAVTVLMDTFQLALVDHLDGCRQVAGEDGPERVCDGAAA